MNLRGINSFLSLDFLIIHKKILNPTPISVKALEKTKPTEEIHIKKRISLSKRFLVGIPSG